MRKRLAVATLLFCALLLPNLALAQAEHGAPGGVSTRRLGYINAAGARCTIAPRRTASCQLDKGTSAVDLAALVDSCPIFGVTDDTTFWIQAWAGDGGDGNVCCDAAAGAAKAATRRRRPHSALTRPPLAPRTCTTIWASTAPSRRMRGVMAARRRWRPPTI